MSLIFFKRRLLVDKQIVSLTFSHSVSVTRAREKFGEGIWGQEGPIQASSGIRKKLPCFWKFLPIASKTINLSPGNWREIRVIWEVFFKLLIIPFYIFSFGNHSLKVLRFCKVAWFLWLLGSGSGQCNDCTLGQLAPTRARHWSSPCISGP